MADARTGKFLVYIGTVTARDSKGIYLCRFDGASGELEMAGLAAELPNPTFLAIHPQGRFLYSVSEAREPDGRREGSVNAFAVNSKTGQLTFLNRHSSRGVGPCHVSVDHTGRCVLVANYVSGSAAILPIRGDGRVGEATDVVQHKGSSVHSERQKGPHAHSITVSPDNRFALVADLGLDRIMIYRLDVAAGRLRPNDPPSAAVKPGAGPRHIAFHPNRPLVYVINEIANTMGVFNWSPPTGAMQEAQTLPTLPPDFRGTSYTADVHAAPSGRFLYGSNRGHDSIAIFRIAEPDGTLSTVGYQPTLGRWPRNFAIDPSGTWLLAANAGQAEGRPPPAGQLDAKNESIVVFRIDSTTGRLSPTGCAVAASVPVCVKMLPGG